MRHLRRHPRPPRGGDQRTSIPGPVTISTPTELETNPDGQPRPQHGLSKRREYGRAFTDAWLPTIHPRAATPITPHAADSFYPDPVLRPQTGIATVTPVRLEHVARPRRLLRPGRPAPSPRLSTSPPTSDHADRRPLRHLLRRRLPPSLSRRPSTPSTEIGNENSPRRGLHVLSPNAPLSSPKPSTGPDGSATGNPATTWP